MLVLSRLLTQSVPLPAAMEPFSSVLSNSVPVWLSAVQSDLQTYVSCHLAASVRSESM